MGSTRIANWITPRFKGRTVFRKILFGKNWAKYTPVFGSKSQIVKNINQKKNYHQLYYSSYQQSLRF